MGKNIRCARVRKTIAIAALPETTHVPMRLHDVTPRWGYLIWRPCSPRLTPGVIRIASLRDAARARRRVVWTVFLLF
jgi:hypothetical protein